MDEYKYFNSELKTFIRYVGSLFPNQKEFMILQVTYKMSKSIDKTMPSKYFNELVVLKYKDKIYTEDDSFIIDYDIDYSIFPIPIQILFSDMKRMNTLWFNIEKNDKEKIWKELKTLVELCEKCFTK